MIPEVLSNFALTVDRRKSRRSSKPTAFISLDSDTSDLVHFNLAFGAWVKTIWQSKVQYLALSIRQIIIMNL